MLQQGRTPLYAAVLFRLLCPSRLSGISGGINTLFARVCSASLSGIKSHVISCEVDISAGLPRCVVVGLPDAAVNEAAERVWAALSNSGFEPPCARVRINLAPADIRKEGTRFDLAMAMAVLAANENSVLRPEHLEGWLIIGELAMNGTVRGVRGVLPTLLAARNLGIRRVLIPRANTEEAALAEGINCTGAVSLRHAAACISGNAAEAYRCEKEFALYESDRLEEAVCRGGEGAAAYSACAGGDLKFVRGQTAARRAVEICAAGSHHLIMLGPPGSGKTMLARCLPSVMPSLSRSEALEVTAIYSSYGTDARELITVPPFRSPSAGISPAGLMGSFRPGEITLAHRGVLFMDEFPEFRRDCLESLRMPLENGEVEIARARMHAVYPCRFILAAAMNPCPCGWWGDTERECTCSPEARRRYFSRLSGPLLDRLDLQVQVSRSKASALMEEGFSESSAEVRKRVEAARSVQRSRGCSNGFMNSGQIARFCVLDKESRRFLAETVDRLCLSGRVKDRICRTSRTIADLEGCERIELKHLREAMEYRMLDCFACGRMN